MLDSPVTFKASRGRQAHQQPSTLRLTDFIYRRARTYFDVGIKEPLLEYDKFIEKIPVFALLGRREKSQFKDLRIPLAARSAKHRNARQSLSCRSVSLVEA